jgi:general stress protein 26
MRVTDFAGIETEFIQRTHSIVWCSVATIDGKGRPRSRILHPIWERSTGWIATSRNSLKAKHLARNPHVSLAYVADITKPVYVDCTAEWVDDQAVKQRVWDPYKQAPPPLGYDPAPFWGSPDSPNFGLLKLTPWRIDLATFPPPSYEEAYRVWQPE